MEQLFIQKDGLLYTPDEKTVIGVDIENNTFTGKIRRSNLNKKCYMV